LLLLLQILFWVSAAAIAHTYLLYPFWLSCKAKGKSLSRDVFAPDEELPEIVVLMAVFNEEKVIAKKLESIFDTTYPHQKLHVWIGSDNSTDSTHQILDNYSHQFKNIKLRIYNGRNGKPKILNQVMSDHADILPSNSILVLTDANVLFTRELLYHLAKHFKRPDVGIVGANVLNIGVKDVGISFQEMWYIRRENVLKHYESIIGGAMMGAFGACYAMKSSLFEPIPDNFIVDDFYLTLTVLEKGFLSIKELKAVCYEDVSDDLTEEYRRKKRISAGNFQNLKRFSHLLLPGKGYLAFFFWSHKVLRWFTPLFLIITYIISAILTFRTNIYFLLFLLQSVSLLFWFADFCLGKFNINIRIFRFARYFYLMNLGLFIGLLKYLKGVKSNVWKPTKRNT